MEEYEALNTLKGDPSIELDELIEKEFIVDPETKSIDGIEDDDYLLDLRKK